MKMYELCYKSNITNKWIKDLKFYNLKKAKFYQKQLKNVKTKILIWERTGEQL